MTLFQCGVHHCGVETVDLVTPRVYHCGVGGCLSGPVQTKPH